MTFKYTYERTEVGEHYDIDNRSRVDGEGNQIHLATEVETALPGEHFVLRCSGEEAVFEFDNELTDTEEITLDATVSDHKSNA